jgi:hypothetical protein
MCVQYKYSLGGTPTYRNVVLPISDVVWELNMCFYVSAPPGTYLSVTPLLQVRHSQTTDARRALCLPHLPSLALVVLFLRPTI